jgi:hypothetical protein
MPSFLRFIAYVLLVERLYRGVGAGSDTGSDACPATRSRQAARTATPVGLAIKEAAP